MKVFLDTHQRMGYNYHTETTTGANNMENFTGAHAIITVLMVLVTTGMAAVLYKGFVIMSTEVKR